MASGLGTGAAKATARRIAIVEIMENCILKMRFPMIAVCGRQNKKFYEPIIVA